METDPLSTNGEVPDAHEDLGQSGEGSDNHNGQGESDRQWYVARQLTNYHLNAHGWRNGNVVRVFEEAATEFTRRSYEESLRQPDDLSSSD